MSENFILGNDTLIGEIETRIKATIGGHGSIMAISGESGLGKSYLLKELVAEYDNSDKIVGVYVENQSPVGTFRVGQMQPLLPFANAIEQILAKTSESAKKKFARNVAMTILATLPVTDMVFYAVKELSRDWKQFKSDKKTATSEESSLTDEFYNSIMQLASQKPLVLFIDDMHWGDAQSVTLLSRFADAVSDYPLQIVFTYKKSVLQGVATPLLSFITEYSDNRRDSIAEKELNPLTKFETEKFLKTYFPKVPDNGFGNWLYEKSLGIPGVIVEYLKYFQNVPEKVQNFDPNNVAENEKFLPSSLNAVFSQTLTELSDEEKNILAVCSGEGRIFSATIVSGLMNTDILSCIKKLRSIQQHTALIHSLGVRDRYGLKTTVYEFTQSFYYDYFRNSLEYEENIALHGQIAALLKQHYNEAESEQIKAQIAPYLAAHSNESGDSETAKAMMLKTAESAAESGDSNLAGIILSNLKEINLIGNDFTAEELTTDHASKDDLKKLFDEIRNGKRIIASDSSAENSVSDDINTYVKIRELIINNFLTANYQYAANKSAIFYNTHFTELNSSQKIQFLALLIRINTALGNFDIANQYAKKAFVLTDAVCDPISESFVLNAYALLKYDENKFEEAISVLKSLAKNALSLPVEIKLVTLTNIAQITRNFDPDKSRIYARSAEELAHILQFDNICTDLEKLNNNG